MGSLNIKSDKAYRQAHELAELTGESITTAVGLAIQERLERKKPNPKAGLAERIMQISRETAPLMNDGRTSKELMDELYDPETGLPI